MLAYLGLIVAPITLYLYAAHPAWMWMYLVDTERVPGFSLIPLTAIHCTAVVVGWALGGRLLLAGRIVTLRNIALGALALTIVGAFVFWGRLGHVGSYREFHEGRALPLMDVKLGYVLVALGIACAASTIYLCVELLRDSRRLRSQ